MRYVRKRQEVIMKKKVLLIAATHGDERLGVDIAKELKKGSLSNDFDFIIGNPKAFQLYKRFIEVDLNRIYPGRKDSVIYEEKRAWKIINIARKYLYIIDIHESSESNDTFIIVPKGNIEDCYTLLELVGVKKVVLWPSTFGRKTGPIAQYLNNCVEIEFGMKCLPRQKALEEGKKIIADFILKVKTAVKVEPDYVKKKNKNLFLVYDKLLTENLNFKNILIDFEEIKINGEKFYPLLSYQYLKNGIVCYKMKKLPA